ncbi:MAG: ABC transporter permease, partial [Mesorhizobium sp.]
PRHSLELVLDNLVWFMLVFVLAVFSTLIPNFFQLGIFANIVEASSVLGVMSIGLALVIIAGHMDLSVESVAALSAMAVGIMFCSSGIGLGLQLHPDWLMVPVSLAVALAVGAIIGVINGFLIVRLQMSAFIITLASYIWVRGLVLVVSGGRSAQDLAPTIRWFGIQRLAIRTSGATANLGVGLLFNAFAAVVIGGVSLKGGVGTLPGVYAGVLLLSAINTAINLMALPANFTQVIHGLLVLAAVLLDAFKQTIRQRLA